MEGEGRLGASLGASERGFDRLTGAGEDCKDAVAEELAFDGGACVLADDGTQRAVQIARLRAEGGVAEALGEGGGVDDVGEENCGQAGRGELGRRGCVSNAGIDEGVHTACEYFRIVRPGSLDYRELRIRNEGGEVLHHLHRHDLHTLVFHDQRWDTDHRRQIRRIPCSHEVQVRGGESLRSNAGPDVCTPIARLLSPRAEYHVADRFRCHDPVVLSSGGECPGLGRV